MGIKQLKTLIITKVILTKIDPGEAAIKFRTKKIKNNKMN